MKRPRGNALIVEVLTDFGSGNVHEKFIADAKCFVHGETTGRRIVINPAIAIVDTVIHETLHRIRPQWSENYVRRTTTWLMRRLSDEQIQAVYDEYKGRVRRKVRTS